METALKMTKKAISLLQILLLFFCYVQVSAQQKNFSSFVPQGYKIFETHLGDLNNDNEADAVLIIKGTDKNHIVKNRFDKMVDRNRRGIIILFKQKGHYRIAAKNYDCFSSENEDGGVYFPPELSISIKKEKLYIDYAHGRYGFWTYTFRFQNSNFELIGYDESNDSGPVIDAEVSINFLTRKKLLKKNTNKNAESGEEVFKETWKKITLNHLIKLTDIEDFDDLDMSVY